MEEATTDTKSRILEATHHLFLEKGLEGVSLRAVTTEAGVNIAAVNYHFGSKAALLAAMVCRVLDEVNAQQLQLLEELEAQTPTPSVEELLIAYAIPIFRLSDTYRGRDWGSALMYARTGSVQPKGHDMLRGMNHVTMEDASETTNRYCTALLRILPQLPLDELLWRFGRASNLLMANQGKQLMPNPSQTSEDQRLDERARLITFLAGALQAPTTAETSIGKQLREQQAKQ